MNHLTIPEIKKLLSEVHNDRHKTMILTTLCHGLRASEVINMVREDIQGGHVKVSRLKGSDKTIQPFVVSDDPELDESRRLTALYNETQPKEKLFQITRQGFYALMRRAGDRAGILSHKCHPHALKHSCAMDAVGRMPINAAQKYLGHKSLASTGHYTKISDAKASRLFANGFGTGIMEDDD